MPPPPEAFPPGWDEVPMPAATPHGRSRPQVKTVFEPTPVFASVPDKDLSLEPEIVQVAAPPRMDAPTVSPAIKLLFRTNTTQAPAKEEHAPQMVTVTLRTSGEPIKDQRRIQRLHGAFISCPGKDHFTLYIKENGHSFMMEFPNDTTHVCPELLVDIKKIVSETDIRIEPILYQ